MSQSHYTDRQTGDVYANGAAWQVLDTGGICADEAWLMDDALGVLGIWSQVRYVYPRAASAYLQPKGKLTSGWAGLLGYNPGENEYRTTDFVKLGKNATDYLGYLDGGAGGHWENYEGCCFVHTGSDQRYYMGLYGGTGTTYELTAYDVWNYVTAGGAYQRWQDEQTGAAVPKPTGPPPTY